MNVYILELIDGRFYCGITNDLVRRLKEHTTKKKGFAARVGVKKLVWSCVVNSRKEARYLEVKIKRVGVKKYLVYLRVSKLI